MQDVDGKVPLYWGKCLDDGVLAFSDDAALLKAGTGSSFAPFPLGELRGTLTLPKHKRREP